jgi:NADH-quinone oxidoreductase subunit I
MAETAKNFFGSYVSKERLTTVQYPEEREPVSESARVFPFLVYDEGMADGSRPAWEAGLRCTSCQICEKECPPKCIFIEKSKDKKPDAFGKQQFYPVRFDIDTAVCMSCQICVEVCPFDSIKMDNKFELATSDRFGGMNGVVVAVRFGKLIDVFQQAAEAAAVDAEREKTKVMLAAKAKAAAEAAAAKAAAATKPATAGEGA